MPAKIALRRSPIHGNGVFAVATVPSGTTLVEYRGRRLAHAEADDIYGDTLETGHTFLFTLNDKYVIDANVGGNVARWINHSCDPNCEAVYDEADSGKPKEDRILIEAIRDIRPGEELTYNYGIVLDEPHTKKMKAIWACRCGSSKCTGTMLQPKRASRA